jgi:hypothetical protein
MLLLVALNVDLRVREIGFCQKKRRSPVGNKTMKVPEHLSGTDESAWIDGYEKGREEERTSYHETFHLGVDAGRLRERSEIVQKLEGLKDGKTPWQSLLFQDCPCGQEVNRKYVDTKFKEVYDNALESAIKKIQK